MKITIELDNVDEAIVALGAVVQARKGGVAGAKKASAASPEVTTGAAVAATPAAQSAPVVEAPTRKGRSDKGQPRGSYKNRPQGSEAGAEPGNVPAARVEPVAAPAEEPPKTEAPTQPSTAREPAAPSQEGVGQGDAAPAASVPQAVPSEKDVQAAIEKVFTSKANQGEGIKAAQECLARVGASRARDVPPELRQKLIDACNDALRP